MTLLQARASSWSNFWKERGAQSSLMNHGKSNRKTRLPLSSLD
jgi:hypothetical protein